MPGFGSYPTGGRMRDAMVKIAKSVIAKERPRYRYGTVLEVDYDLHKAAVILNGDSDPVRVSVGSIWPAVGEVVRVDGIGTDRYVADVISVGRTAKVLSARNEAEFQDVARSVTASPGVPLLVLMTNTYGIGSVRMSDDGVVWSSISTTMWGVVWHPVTLNPGWTNYGSVYSAANYVKSSSGIVAIRGLVIPPSTGTSDIFTLPAGYRPAARMTFNAINGTGRGRIDVWPDGRVQAVGLTANTFLTLQLMFPSETVAPELDWNPLTLANGFEQADPDQVPGYWQDAQGRVWLRGSIKNAGTPAADTLISATLSGLGPTLRSLFSVNNSSDGGYVDITNPGSLRWKATNNTAYTSLAGVCWYPAAYPSTELTKASGWTNYSSTTPPPGYRLGTDGIVTLEGLLSTPSTAPANTSAIITGMPTNVLPDTSMRAIHGVASTTGYQRVDTGGTGRVGWGNSANAYPSWITLNGIQYMVGS